MTSVRLFVALPTPPAVRDSIERAAQTLRETGAEVKWEPSSRLHCTIRFLGDTPVGLLPPLGDALAAAALPLSAPRIVYRGFGAFPDLRDPRVLWIGMEDPTGTLLRLRSSIESALVALGIPREEKAFHPHVTLGRVKGRRNIRELLRTAETVTFESPPVTVATIELIRSDLRPSGSVYTVLRAFPLGS